MILLDGYEVLPTMYPDATFRINSDTCRALGAYSHPVRTDRLIRQRRAAHIRPDFDIVWKYEGPQEQVLIDLLVRHLKDRLFADEIHLTMPYIPNARMDRTHDLVGEVNTLKYFCEWLNSLNFASVSVMDPHSDASMTMIDRVLILDHTDFVKNAVESFPADLIFFPDEGAYKRYSADYNWRPFLHGMKNRDWATGKILGLEIENPMHLPEEKIRGKRVMIIDDICSKGGTFHHSAVALKKLGVGDIGLCVTHLEKTVFAGKLLGADHDITDIYTTDSIFHEEHDKIHVCEIQVN